MRKFVSLCNQIFASNKCQRACPVLSCYFSAQSSPKTDDEFTKARLNAFDSENEARERTVSHYSSFGSRPPRHQTSYSDSPGRSSLRGHRRHGAEMDRHEEENKERPKDLRHIYAEIAEINAKLKVGRKQERTKQCPVFSAQMWFSVK